MTTTIRTSSKNYFERIQKYLESKRVFFIPSTNIDGYTLTIFGHTEGEITSLIKRMTSHFHLINKQQEPLALAG